MRKRNTSIQHDFIYYVLAFLIGCILLGTFIISTYLPSPEKIIKMPENIFTQISLPNSIFINNLNQLAKEQFKHYLKTCGSSDVIRPLSSNCRNYTFFSETKLSYLALNQLFQDDYDLSLQIDSKLLKNIFQQNKTIELGRIADNVINPLISAYFVSHKNSFLEKALLITNEILSTYNGPIPPPYINSGKKQHFGENEVFIDDVSSIFPTLTSLYYITHDNAYLNHVKAFVNHIRKSIQDNIVPIKFSLDNYKPVSTSKHDFPFRLFADLHRISRILPSITTSDITKIGSHSLHKENPLTIYDENYVKVISIEPCWYAVILQSDDPLYSTLVKKCKNLVKRKCPPSRMNGNSEFGSYDLLTQFEFEGELLELYWKNELLAEYKKMINNVIDETKNKGFITGIRNSTKEGKRSDDFLHPQFFSRYILNSILVESGIKYEDVVLSDGGHILKM
ncbi:hypothetical protein TRFO_24870 [Tritrichomonas foetus]|uniref:Uncharacterized protein n=1 Tax=Tritrichomonas foetus TaxID=1144522 RepID=A0A1J4K6B1_9EUKA|nr:hypothetical protein TRFO_24870 [Tritrichomonas foetus]|eukprot:OHT06985.1 hypothetical protein TRFO_24870 [Tritrichomonas foetus]